MRPRGIWPKKEPCFPTRLCHNPSASPALIRGLTTTKTKTFEPKITMTHDETAGALFFGLGMMAVVACLFVGLAIYLFSSFCFLRICEKCGVKPGALVWIPIVQLVPLLEVAKLPVWMIILFFIPIANLVVFFMMWAKICAARGRSEWLVLLFLVPIANLILVPYLAFAE